MNLRSDQHFFYAIQIQYDKIYISNCECENYEYDVMWENVDRRLKKNEDSQYCIEPRETNTDPSSTSYQLIISLLITSYQHFFPVRITKI